MAAFNFPANPTDGQLYPDPALPGQQQYVYSSAKSTWQTVSRAVAQVFGQSPVVIKGSQQAPIVTVNQASDTQAGYITPSDFARIQEIPDTPGTVTEIVAGVGLDVTPAFGDDEVGVGESITTKGTLNVIPATRTTLGGVKPGAGLNITSDGRIDVTSATEDYAVIANIAGQFNGVKTSFDLLENGVQIFPTDVTRVWIFLGGVFQTPGSAFTLTAGQSTITFTEPPEPGTTFYGVVFL
jgi:hypothetical protein